MLFCSSVMTALCSTVLIPISSEEDLTLASIPHGNCEWCCPLNISEDIRLLLYTKNACNESIQIHLNDPGPAFEQAQVDPYNPTVFYIHGFIERAPSYASLLMKDSYLARGDYNVILVDWSRLSAAPWYKNAVRNTRIVGRIIADFIQRADSGGLISLDKVHVIGFSLGGEVAGFIGKNMPLNRRIPRITGLDPAFPLFSGGNGSHLAPGDANFVDVIHTDGGKLGYPSPIGDCDFFPNGGKPAQPGCHSPKELSFIAGCSHFRSWKFYAESLGDPYGFPATKCKRWTGISPPCNFTVDNYMGIMADPNNKGQFYLETNSQSPFAKGVPKENGEENQTQQSDIQN